MQTLMNKAPQFAVQPLHHLMAGATPYSVEHGAMRTVISL